MDRIPASERTLPTTKALLTTQPIFQKNRCGYPSVFQEIPPAPEPD
jgi:hypothetical protein